jgi:hypothetical protein
MRVAALILACASVCLAQLDDNTVTITATRTVALQPDQATISINLTTPRNAGIDDAIAALQGTGLAAGDLVSVSTLTLNVGSGVYWTFRRAVPFSALKDTLTAVVAAQQALEKRSPGFVFTYYVSSQASQAAQNSPALCPMTTLLADAQTQAQQVARAAGVRLGGVVSMRQGGGQIGVPILAVRTGDFSAIYDPVASPVASLATFLYTPPLPAAACSLTVQFQLLH